MEAQKTQAGATVTSVSVSTGPVVKLHGLLGLFLKTLGMGGFWPPPPPPPHTDIYHNIEFIIDSCSISCFCVDNQIIFVENKQYLCTSCFSKIRVIFWVQ